MAAVVAAWCPKCVGFVRPRVPIGGHGGKVIITGHISTPCPRCGTQITTPGGEFYLDNDLLMRVSDTLSTAQAEELKSKLARLRETGCSLEGLRTLVEGYAPQLLPYIEQLQGLPSKARTNWILLVLLILWQLAHNTTCHIDVKLDMNRLLDNAVTQANQEIHPAAQSSSETGRNDPCPCGSGKKFKKCCGGQK